VITMSQAFKLTAAQITYDQKLRQLPPAARMTTLFLSAQQAVCFWQPKDSHEVILAVELGHIDLNRPAERVLTPQELRQVLGGMR
jgi:hypothetical protein